MKLPVFLLSFNPMTVYKNSCFPSIYPYMKTIVIHGHFYQPPRENPWSGLIGDQPSAAPYNNWNQRILEECYEANGWSPVLNPKGQTCCIINNYEYLSFNFGPTLLSWIRENAELTYEKIREGDKKSQATNRGHGNAIAQVYNHIIMPLAQKKDRLTQIEWGIRDFQFHFNRDPEGMWLSETAIHPDTAEELVKSGIKYTILSPWQAKSFRMADGSEIEANNKPELWQHPWTLPCPSGDLTVFFYHPGLSSDISFQHLLRDANNFFDRIKEELSSGSGQLPVATDGEIYGHHEKLGNMGLSAFISKVASDKSLEMGNFGSLMETAPSAGIVNLLEGEEKKGTSWSCSHGVSRWYKNCGCHTGGEPGWNQEWRTPLREGFKKLSEITDNIYLKGMSRLSGIDPWEIRNHYIEVLLDPSESEAFYSEFGPKKASLSDKNLFFRLLEGQKNKMFMFTSCGWFFSDIAGIEPMQNMMYAARVIELYSPFFSFSPETILLDYLADAESNEPAKGNGAVLYTGRKFEQKKERHKLAAWMIINRYYDLKAINSQTGYYRTEEYRMEKTSDHMFTGEITLKNCYTQARERFFFEIQAENRLFSRLTLDEGGKSFILKPEDLPLTLKKNLLKTLSITRSTTSQAISDQFGDTVDQLTEMMLLGMPDSSSLKDSLNALLYYTLREITYMMELNIEGAWSSYGQIILTAKEKNIPLPVDLMFWLQDILDRKIAIWRQSAYHSEEDWDLAYKGLKILLSTSGNSSERPITHTQTGMICDFLFYSPEGGEILADTKKNLVKELLEDLNLSEDFHHPECACQTGL